MLTELAPVTFHDRVDVPSVLRLLLKSVITAGVPIDDVELTIVATDL
jgi:hypothetical protein